MLIQHTLFGDVVVSPNSFLHNCGLFSSIVDLAPLPEMYVNPAGFHEVFRRDQLYVTFYPFADMYNVTRMKVAVRRAGFEREDDRKRRVVPQSGQPNRSRVLRRVRSVTRALVLSNPWDFWYTQTFAASNVDRESREACYAALRAAIRRMERRCGCHVDYLLFPERHADGAYHFHGFLTGVPSSEMRFNRHGYLEVSELADTCGYVNLKNVKRSEEGARLLSYALKYAQKSVDTLERGEHSYYCSHGLSRGEKITICDTTSETYKTWERVIAAAPWRYNSDYCVNALVDGRLVSNLLCADVNADNGE